MMKMLTTGFSSSASQLELNDSLYQVIFESTEKILFEVV